MVDITVELHFKVSVRGVKEKIITREEKKMEEVCVCVFCVYVCVFCVYVCVFCVYVCVFCVCVCILCV